MSLCFLIFSSAFFLLSVISSYAVNCLPVLHSIFLPYFVRIVFLFATIVSLESVLECIPVSRLYLMLHLLFLLACRDVLDALHFDGHQVYHGSAFAGFVMYFLGFFDVFSADSFHFGFITNLR